MKRSKKSSQRPHGSSKGRADDQHNGRRKPVGDSSGESSGSSARNGKTVGYRKPPRRYSWKKGQSGNPAGREKGSKNKRTIIIKLMEQKLGRKIDNIEKLTRYEAMMLKGIQQALKGDTKAMSFILKRYDDAAEANAGPMRDPTEQDEVVYAALVEKIKLELMETDDGSDES